MRMQTGCCRCFTDTGTRRVCKSPPPRWGVDMLEMKPGCEKCGTPLNHDAAAWSCSYECTFCPHCHNIVNACPNCGGELTPRPRRAARGASAS
ncbi:DUF1272 domain-containing protein [Mycobacteroides abscessus]|uniref:DUF1272 domain-containing protein n=1 Tax=Mycobacteroides abscessus TaxID=36809 RepID=UPI002D21D647|nr:DUF1272 domain-containing protein [Mycobacteroides abscessus]